MVVLQLMDTKAPSDRTITLLHYVAKVIRDKYPQALDFIHELTYLKKAAAGTYTLIKSSPTPEWGRAEYLSWNAWLYFCF